MCGRYRRTTAEEELATRYHIAATSLLGLLERPYVGIREDLLKAPSGIFAGISEPSKVRTLPKKEIEDLAPGAKAFASELQQFTGQGFQHAWVRSQTRLP